MKPLQKLRALEEIKSKELDAIRSVIVMLEEWERPSPTRGPDRKPRKKPVKPGQGISTRIVLALKTGQMTASELAKAVGANVQNIYATISVLRRKKLVENAPGGSGYRLRT